VRQCRLARTAHRTGARRTRIAAGTSGRVIDHLERGYLSLEALNTLMLDMSFFYGIATVIRQCPKKWQTLLFSATHPESLEMLATQFMRVLLVHQEYAQIKA
jgi:superfamily II DNA/RNA helicase